MANIRDTDLLYVQRGDTPHRWTGLELKECISGQGKDGVLTVGQYLTPNGQTYDGSSNIQINVDGVSTATANKVVVRDGNGDFAGNTITAVSFVGDGSGLDNTGASLGVVSGTERLVSTSLTTGTMTSASTDVDLTFTATDSVLDIGQGKIILKGSDGSITAAGGDIELKANGQVWATRYFGIGPAADDKVWSGYLTNTTGAATSFITAAGNIVTGNDPGVAGRPAGIRTGSNGTLQISKADGEQGVVIYKTGTDLAQIELKTDGSITAAGSGTFGSGGAESILCKNNNSTLNNNATIYAANEGGGTVFMSGPDFSPANRTIAMFADGSITADGGASFKGDVTVSDGTTGSAVMYKGGYFTSNRTSGTYYVIEGQLNGTQTSIVLANGNAKFDGRLEIGNAVSSGYKKGFLCNADNAAGSYLQVYADSSATQPPFSVWNGSGLGSVFQVFADGSVIAQSTVTAPTFSGAFSGTASNALKLNNKTNDTAATASTIVERDASGQVFVKFLNMNHTQSTRIADTIFYSSTDNYVYKNSASGFRESLNVPDRTGGGASGTWGISVSGNAATASNADKLDGYDSSQSATGNTVAARSGEGHLYMNYSYQQWINARSTGGDSIAAQGGMVSWSTDGWYRHYNQAQSQSVLDVPSRTGANASGTWGIYSSGVAIQNLSTLP